MQHRLFDYSAQIELQQRQRQLLVNDEDISWEVLSFLVCNRKCRVFQALCSVCMTALNLLDSLGRIEPFWLYKHHSSEIAAC